LETQKRYCFKEIVEAMIRSRNQKQTGAREEINTKKQRHQKPSNDVIIFETKTQQTK